MVGPEQRPASRAQVFLNPEAPLADEDGMPLHSRSGRPLPRIPRSERGQIGAYAAASLGVFGLVGIGLNLALAAGVSWAIAVGGSLVLLYIALFSLVILASRSVRAHEHAQLRRFGEDELTGLPNREQFRTQLTGLLERRTDDDSVTLLLIDIDGFQLINETVGRERGDLVLERVGRRLAGRIRDEDLVGRVGGDEFAIAVDGLASGSDLARVAYRFLGVMTEAVQVDGIDLDVRCSVGIARYPDDADDATSLLQRADIALSAAKRNRSVIEVYEPDLDHFSPDALELAAEVRAGIAENQFALEFQPKTEIASGELTGFEAIVRWNHPSRGRVPPASFMSAVAALPIARDLTHHVLCLALEQVGLWRDAGLDTSVAVNLTARDASDPRLPRAVTDLLDATDLEPRHLELELNEDAVLGNPDQTRVVLTELRRVGCRVTIDDFGTGMASINSLSSLPLDALKLDRKAVAAMTDDPRAEAVARNVVDLGHALGLEVIGVGIAEDGTLSAVTRIGCDTVQGCGVEGPLPPAEIERRFAGGDSFAPAAAADPPS